LERELRDALAAASPVEPSRRDYSRDAQQMIDVDFAPPAPHSRPEQNFRLWSNDRCIVASRAQTVMPNFAVARNVSREAGWAVVRRRSGGTAVVHRPGILNVSWQQTLPARPQAWITVGYQAFLDLLIRAMSRLGLQCDHGPVPGSHCDGRFNLRHEGRKLAGTAAYAGAAAGTCYCVFHGSITVSGSIAEDLTAIERFERCLGVHNAYDPSTHVSLSELVAARAATDARCTQPAIAMRR
jgi:lipoate-protein ligase A